MPYGDLKVDSITTSVHKLTLPIATGSNGQALITNGSGTLSWSGVVASVNGSSGAITNVAVTNAAQSFSAAQRGTVSALTSAASVTPDFAVANNFSLTLAHGVTLQNPTNLTAGQSGVIVITQAASGTAYTVTYGSAWKFVGGAPSISSTFSSVNVIAYYVESASRITATLLTNTIS